MRREVDSHPGRPDRHTGLSSAKDEAEAYGRADLEKG
jgi:hypothetical protein